MKSFLSLPDLHTAHEPKSCRVGTAFVPTRIVTAWANKKPFAHPTPVRFTGSVVQTVEWVFLDGPERIEAGWWDGKKVRRDYYMARNPEGQTVWVYRDWQQHGRWFLHGLFA